MNEPFEGEPGNFHDDSPGEGKKKKLWKNMFLINLCVTLFLIGLFWLPLKMGTVNKFLDSPSVNLPKQGETAKKSTGSPVPQTRPENLLPTHFAIINASSEKDWAYFDLSRGTEVKIHDPSSLEWDLAFRRGKVISNGGATNKLGLSGLIDLGQKVEYDQVTEVPKGDYVQDKATRTETENPVLVKWFKYNFLTHKLSAKKNVYALRTANEKFAKFQFLSFYCENKESGCIQLRYTYQTDGTNSFLLQPANNPENPAAVAATPEPDKI